MSENANLERDAAEEAGVQEKEIPYLREHPGPTDPQEQFILGCRFYYGTDSGGNIVVDPECAECRFYCGTDGGGRDPEQAAYWFRKAAEQGHAGAQNNLGMCYYWGQGVEQDWSQAARWYRRAAEQGEMYAQYNLALCCHYARGVDKDLEQAAHWYRKAAEQGHMQAKEALDRWT